jgi:peptidase E
MLHTFSRCFAWHGLTLESAELLDARNGDSAEELIGESDVIILGGGHVPTENAFFKEIGLREMFRGYEGVVIGISAGTMNCADLVYAQPEMEGESIDPDYERFIEGLGLTDVNVLTHYQKVKNYILDGKRLYEDITYPDSFGHTFFALPDSSYVLQDEDGVFLFGEGYCIADGVIEQICADGECVKL